MRKFFKLICICLILSFFLWPIKTQAAEVWEQVGGYGLGDNDNLMVIAMTTWNNALYAGIGNPIDGARIYRSTDGNTWTKVNNDGFGHVALNTIIDFASFGNSLFATSNEDGPAPAQAAEIWKSADGVNWVQSGNAGLGHAHNTGFYKMAEFNGQLYVGSRNIVDGGEMYISPDGTNWTVIANTVGGFGDANNTVIWGLESFGGWLWAGTSNLNGAQIWRSPDGINWFKYFDYATTVPPMPDFVTVNNILTFGDHLLWYALNANGGQIIKRHTEAGEWLEGSLGGLGDVNNTWLSENTVVQGSLIYFGTRNNITGGELWYSADGINAIQIGQDGFGNPDNYAIYALTFKDYLYIGLSSGNLLKGCEIWRRTFTASFGLTPKKLPQGQQGNSYLTKLEASGGKTPYTYSITKGSLPAGLALNPNTGEINGTPKDSGDFQFTVEVQDNNKKPQRSQTIYTLRIVAGVSDSSPLSGVAILPLTGID